MTFAEMRRQAVSLLAVVAVCTMARASLADHYYVPSESMEPTVHVGDQVIVDKAAYGLRLPLTESYLFELGGPQPGDVVVLDSPDDDKVLLKRIAAGPGDVVTVRRGMLERNGEPVRTVKEGDTLYEELGASRHPLDLEDGGGPAFG